MYGAPMGQAPGVAPFAALSGPTAADPGWARTAGYLGIATSIVVGGLTVATVATNDDQDTSLPLGIVATVIGGVMIPVVAMGGASARNNPAVEGLPSLRTSSWVGYAAALVDAAVLIGLSLGDAAAPAAVTASVGVLGVASCTGMTLDAFESASQAEAFGGPQRATQQLALAPFVAPVGRAHQGMVVGVGGAL